MKLLTGIAVSAVLLAGCADKGADVDVVAEADTAVAVAQPAAATSMFVEYMYCDGGADFSRENYAQLTAAWNEINDQSTTPVAGAFSIVPKVESNLYDGMWANIWSSVEARDAGWADWSENQAEAFGAKFDSTMVCNPEKTFLFETTPLVAPMQQWDPANLFQASYSFCSFKEGKTPEDGARAQAALGGWMTDQRTAGRGTNYMSYLQIPTFDPATAGGSMQAYQFVRADFWASAEEQAADMAAWMLEGNEARELSDATYDCQAASFDLYSIKRLAS